MRSKSFLFFILPFSFFVYGQVPKGSSTLIQACVRNTNCYHAKTPSYIYYNEGKAEFTLKINLSGAGQNDSLGKWVQGINNFQYVAHLDKDRFPSPSNYNANHVTLNGIVTINGISHQQPVDITIYQIEEMITNSPNTDFYDKYRVDLSIPVAPKDFDLGSDIKGTLFIAVSSGLINGFSPPSGTRSN